MSNIVVIAPHPDDETLGCGGTLLRHKAEGDSIHWVIMTTLNDKGDYDKERVATRKEEIKYVASEYGFESVYQTNYITTELDVVPVKDLIDEVSTLFHEIKPDTIYVPFGNDVHSDHKVVFDVVASCSKSFRYPFIRKVRAYETISETEFGLRPGEPGFKPNLWINISGYLEKKIEIMNIFTGEVGVHPFPRSERNIKALATFRGATAGCEYAEAFMSLSEFI